MHDQEGYLAMRFVGALLLAAGMGAAHAAAPTVSSTQHIILEPIREPFTGDLPQLRERRMLRVLVSFGRTGFFVDHGRPRGFEYELVRQYERFINRGVTDRRQRVQVVFVPMPHDQLLQALEDGRGDVVAAGLNITPERGRRVAFTAPYISGAKTVVVAQRAVSQRLTSVEDLAGRKIYVPPGTSYERDLTALSLRLLRQGRAPVQTMRTDRSLFNEDVLALVNGGILPLTVVDRHIAEIWAKVLPNIVVRDDLVVQDNNRIAWAVRKDNPQLRDSINEFMGSHRRGSLIGNVLFKRYYVDNPWIKNPISIEKQAKLQPLIELFRKYGNRYDFDWLALAAQAYQESRFDQKQISPAGAVGIMQVRPTTAADRRVAVSDIHELEANIHAGVKYLSWLRKRYFNSPDIDPSAQVNFTWAAYNAGPAKINRLRREAERLGLDPNRWFGHVEQVAAQEIGPETVDYVANINNYYVSYRLAFDEGKPRQEVLDRLMASAH